jgi:hypothetical protein
MKTKFRCWLALIFLLAAQLGMVGCGGPERQPEGTAVKPGDAVIPVGPGGMPTPPGVTTTPDPAGGAPPSTTP